jgi:ABC-type sugar transport system permease subunit
VDPGPFFYIYYFLLQALFTFHNYYLLTANKYHLPHDTFNPLFSANRWDWQPHCKLGKSILVVLCAGSTLLLAQTPHHQWFLLASLPKSASNNLWKWFLSPTGRLNLSFILREDLLLCSSYLPLGFPNWSCETSRHFLAPLWGERGFLQGDSLTSNLFYFVIVFLSLFTLFLFASFYQKYKKISSFYSCYFCLSILVSLEWVFLKLRFILLSNKVEKVWRMLGIE